MSDCKQIEVEWFDCTKLKMNNLDTPLLNLGWHTVHLIDFEHIILHCYEYLWYHRILIGFSSL